MANQPTPEPQTVTIEADTVEEALAHLSDQLGHGATIVSAERVRRGGIGGFFAKEVVEITATVAGVAGGAGAADRPIEAPVTTLERSAGPAGRGGVEATFARLLAEADEASAATAQTAAVAAPTIAPPYPAPTVAATAPQQPTVAVPQPVARPDVPAPDATFDPSAFLSKQFPPSPPPMTPEPAVVWDARSMVAVGLPETLVSFFAGLDPADDLGHLTALASRLAANTGAVRMGAHRLAGSAAGRLADALGIEAADDDSSAPIHLVVSGDPLPDRLPGMPDIVSWTDATYSPKAIALAIGTGARLGWSMASDFGASPRRLTALDAAWAIRDLMERR